MKRPTSLLLLLLLLRASFVTAQPKVIALRNVTVIDMTGAPPKRNMTVVVRGTRISAIGSNRLRISRGAQVVDGTDKFLIPGLWDMHVHFTRADTTFPLFIANGVTGVRNMGGELEQLLRWGADVAAGKVVGPRIVACGPIIDGPPPAAFGPTVVVKDAAEARSAVERLKRQGANCVKVYDRLPRDAYFAIIAEAKKMRMPVVGHVPLSLTSVEASEAGQRSIEHLGSILESCSTLESELFNEERTTEPITDPSDFPRRIAARGTRMLDTYDAQRANQIFAHFVRNQTWQVPTLEFKWAQTFIDDLFRKGDDRLRYIPESDQQRWSPTNNFFARYRTPEYISFRQRLWQKELDLVRAMHNAGVPFMAGTDLSGAFVFPGFSLHHELELLVLAGFTPMEALQAATRSPAAFLGELDSQGTIEKGKLANLVLLDSSPLVDIRNTATIYAVVVNGRFFSRTDLNNLLLGAAAAARNK